jgi:transcription antitermination protein NusB
LWYPFWDMALPQQKFREVVFQLLYSFDFVKIEDEETWLLLMNQLKITKKSLYLAQERVNLIHAKQEAIDEAITKASISYGFNRIPRVEKNVLRLSLFEMLHDNSIPNKVAIAEAIRLTRKFASPEGATFVNGVLDTILKEANVTLEV